MNLHSRHLLGQPKTRRLPGPLSPPCADVLRFHQPFDLGFHRPLKLPGSQVWIACILYFLVFAQFDVDSTYKCIPARAWSAWQAQPGGCFIFFSIFYTVGSFEFILFEVVSGRIQPNSNNGPKKKQRHAVHCLNGEGQ